ncbi:MAG TPA: hypothetical protein VJS43_18365 [Candidatus Acidoferrales bacterium]|nr:hypothetical protein [Candidatus Acidoferrales bacterium]
MTPLIRTLLIAIFCLLGAGLGTARAQAQYKVGDRVDAPFGPGYLDSVVIAVDPNSPFPFRVHPLGYLNTMDTSFNAQMLKPPGSEPTRPIGGIVDDPWLLKVQGKKAFHPERVYRGPYECFSLGGTRPEARLTFNFTIVDDHRYRDAAGKNGTYEFDAGAATLTFKGGVLDGQHATYHQASDPPTHAEPPAITLTEANNRCDHPIR